jgi:hypothetical protein
MTVTTAGGTGALGQIPGSCARFVARLRVVKGDAFAEQREPRASSGVPGGSERPRFDREDPDADRTRAVCHRFPARTTVNSGMSFS